MKHHQLLAWKAPASKQKQFHLKFYDWKYDDVVISVLRSIRLPRKPCNFVEYLDEKELYKIFYRGNINKVVIVMKAKYVQKNASKQIVLYCELG